MGIRISYNFSRCGSETYLYQLYERLEAVKWFEDYQKEAFRKNKVNWFGRLLCAIGWHSYDEVYCIRCEHRAYTLE